MDLCYNKLVNLIFIVLVLPQILLGCSRGRHDNILHSDDLIILEMDSQIETTSLIEYLAESNELKLTIRSGSIDEFGEMKINISAMWENETSMKLSNITIDPQEIIFTSPEDKEELTIANVDIPRRGTERRLLVIASGSICTNEEMDCKKTTKYIAKRHILIKNGTNASSEPRQNIAFDRKYKGCSDEMKIEERCGNETWTIDFTIPYGMFLSGLSKVIVKDENEEQDQIKFWHPNFDIGASEEVKIFTNASCCIERMDLEAIGISEGESQSVSILSNGGSGGDESSGSEYHLTAIVSIITICVIMGVVLAALFYRRKRRSFSL